MLYGAAVFAERKGMIFLVESNTLRPASFKYSTHGGNYALYQISDFSITQDFCFSRMIKNILKTQYLCKSHLANDSNCNIKFSHNTNVIPITGIYNILAVLGKVEHREKSSPLR